MKRQITENLDIDLDSETWCCHHCQKELISLRENYKKDENEYYYFVDRKKDAIRRRGENISSFEVEKVINTHHKILESAVFAVPSELGEDEVKANLVLKPGEDLAPEVLIEYCNERMAYFAIPRYLEFVSELPKTPTNRVEKYRLRKMGITEDTWDREKAGVKITR